MLRARLEPLVPQVQRGPQVPLGLLELQARRVLLAQLELRAQLELQVRRVLQVRRLQARQE